MKKTFLLSPAGSPAALKAAINAGADEVYLGGSEFNARMNANNFDRGELKKAKMLCKNANVRLHITLNTLAYDREFKAITEYVDFLANEVEPNALIVQDLGLACVLRREFKQIPLHASTQMRIHSPYDAQFLKDLGFTRAVLARELPKSDIAEFVKSGLETEIFIHGAICVSESGGCLMSSVIGNRSGNRGECAQPCRLPYRSENKYPLSLKDMCLARHITEINETGATSLKIEGRMKSPEYVGAVTSVYRKLIDENRNASENEMKLLANVFSRSGFTNGYFINKIDKEMFGIRREEDKKASGGKPVYFNVPPRKNDYNEPKPTEPQFPERESEKTLSPKLQRGFVLRFEGRLPSDEFLKKYAQNAARIDIPLESSNDPRFKNYAEKISVVLPRSIFLNERETVKKQLENAKKIGINQATVSSLNQTKLCDGFYLHGDYSFNVTNRETLEYLENLNFSSVMLSPESDGKFIKSSRCALEYIGYGRTPLMYTRTCIIANINGCLGKKRCFASLTDRIGAEFPIISAPNHTNIIYNSLVGYRLDKKNELKKAGIGLITLFFTDENEKTMSSVTDLALNGGKPDFEYTRR